MAITVQVKPDLSAFKEVAEEDLADRLITYRSELAAEAVVALARLLLAEHWIIKR